MDFFESHSKHQKIHVSYTLLSHFVLTFIEAFTLLIRFDRLQSYSIDVASRGWLQTIEEDRESTCNDVESESSPTQLKHRANFPRTCLR